MKTSAGIIIKNEYNEYLLGHATGKDFFDLFKGKAEENEDFMSCALRECEEESGLVFNPEDLVDLGLFEYLSDKNLYLFLTFVNKKDINLSKLKCSTYFTNKSGKEIPEMDGFQWIKEEDIPKFTGKNLNRVLTNLFLYDPRLEAKQFKHV